MFEDRNNNEVDSSSEIKKDVFENRKSSKVEKRLDLDDVLTTELGQFGWFQLRNILLVAVPIAMSAFMSEYVFSAAAIPHRCRISECGEEGKLHQYDPDWLQDAVPKTSSGFDSCERYVSANTGTNGSLDYCPSNLFDQRETVGCDGFVYARDNSIVYEFDLGCQDFLRALVGTLNSVGTLLVLPITGYFSDRFGRRWALIVSVFNMGVIGLIRAFSVNLPMYMALQILQTTLGAGTYSSAYIFAAELVGPKYRVVTSAISSSMFAVGQVILGGVAWLIQPWRYMIMAIHIPCLLIVCYYWFLSESIRWLLSKKKYTEARIVLEKVARVNKTFISEKSIEALMYTHEDSVPTTEGGNDNVFKKIIRSPILLRRVCTTPIWWITTTFVYYGLSINSTSLSDSMYLNYILTVAIEIPGYFTAVLVLDRIGRKITLATGFFFSAACNIAFVFIPNHLSVLRLIIFLLGKFGISAVMTSLYLFTSELYPTEYRHSLLAFSSMIGRVGSITAPLTPVLMNYWHGIPSMMFAAMGILSGILVLTQPETLGIKMPDTLEEAEALGKKTETFDLGCQDFLRALVGTLNSVGTLLVLPITGYFSDRFGRRWALIVSVFNMGVIGLIRAFSVNLSMYMALQILQTTLGAGTYSSAYIFAAELVGPKYRVMTSAISSSMFAVGQVILGGVAWLIQPWRYMIMTLHIPCLLIFCYYWFLSESIRWLLSKKKYTEAKTVLEKVARVNKTFISEKSIEALIYTPEDTVPATEGGNGNLLKKIISSPILLRRVCTTPIWWITTTFVYYGLSINSTSLSDSMYLNYILTSAIEIPGNFTVVLVLDRIGRKITLATGFFFSAACNIAFVFIPNHLSVLRLIIFLLGKFGISAVMMALYLFTSELYPTKYRHSLLAFSSMIGRVGSITAPLTPVLMNYWHGIPSMMFAAMGILSGILVLTQPETSGIKMPDTLEEAEALGKKTET